MTSALETTAAYLVRVAPGLILGALMLLFSARVYYHRTGAKADRCARQLFGFSILYLFLLFAAIVGERLVAISAWNIPW